VILCDDDLIEWDDDYPPQLGQEEDKAQSMRINHIVYLFYRCFVFSYTFNSNV
jgi:hypothetical protein